METTPASSAGAAVGTPPPEGATSAAPSGLFVRKSSGLVRELGIRDAFALNIGGVNPVGAGFFFFAAMALFPGMDFSWPLVIALGGAILLCLMYSQLVATMPRSGADFVYVSRIIHPSLGSAVGFAFFAFIITGGGGLWVELFANTYLPFAVQTAGEVFHSHGLVTFSTTLTHKGWVLGVSATVCLIAAWLLMKRVGVMAKATYYVVGVSLVAYVVLIVELLVHSPGAFQHAFNAHVHNPHAYRQMIATAHKSGFTTGVKTSAVLASVSLVNFFYVGATFANYTGGELRKPGGTFRSSVLVCLAVAVLSTLGGWLALKHELGLPFVQSVGQLSSNDPTAYSKLAGDVMPFSPSFTLLVASNPVSKLVIAFGFAAGVLGVIFAGVVVLTRLLFAMSFDRVLPAAVSNVRPKSHAPVTAAAIVAFLMFAVTAMIVYTSILQATRNFTLVATGVFAISSFSAAILPWRQRRLYEQSPKVVGTRILGMPAITFIGGLSCIYWLFGLYLGATKTQVSGGYDTRSVVTLAGTCLIGVVAYGISRVSLRRKGVDLDLALHELPPE